MSGRRAPTRVVSRELQSMIETFLKGRAPDLPKQRFRMIAFLVETIVDACTHRAVVEAPDWLRSGHIEKESVFVEDNPAVTRLPSESHGVFQRQSLSIRQVTLNAQLVSKEARCPQRQLTETRSVKILVASTPAAGHLNPILAVSKILKAAGHEVVGLTGTWLRDRVEGAGLKFDALSAGADLDARDILALIPELRISSRAGTRPRGGLPRLCRHHPWPAQRLAAGPAGFPCRRHHRRRYVFRYAADAARAPRKSTCCRFLRHIDLALPA